MVTSSIRSQVGVIRLCQGYVVVYATLFRLLIRILEGISTTSGFFSVVSGFTGMVASRKHGGTLEASLGIVRAFVGPYTDQVGFSGMVLNFVWLVSGRLWMVSDLLGLRMSPLWLGLCIPFSTVLGQRPSRNLHSSKPEEGPTQQRL